MLTTTGRCTAALTCLARSRATAATVLAPCVAGACRWSSSAATGGAGAPVPATTAAPTAVARVPTTEEASARGLDVTPSWARFNLVTRSKFDLAEATKAPVLSGVEDQAATRKAIIYRVSPSAMTSGMAASGGWALRWNHEEKWANPLMGWLSSANTLAQTTMHLKFETPDQAITLCKRNGWAYEVAPGSMNAVTPGKVDNQYAYNFLPRDVQTKMKAAGPKKATALFHNPAAGKAAWVNLRRTQFGAEAWKPASYQTKDAWTGPEWPAPAAHRTDEHH